MFWGLGHHMHFWLPFSFLGKFMWLVILALVIVALLRWLNLGGRQIPFVSAGPPVQLSALDILHERYARGEIDTATFEHMRERLESPGRPKP